MNQCYNSNQSMPSVPAARTAKRVSDIIQRQKAQMDEEVQLPRSLREELEEMIEPSHFDYSFRRPKKLDASRDAYYRGSTSHLLKRAKSRNPTLKQSKSAGGFAFCQGSTMSFSSVSKKNSHIPAEYGGYDLRTYSTKLLSRLSSTEASVENDQW